MTLRPVLSAVFSPRNHYQVGKTFWQHSGDGISSRRAEYCHKAFEDGVLSVKANESIEFTAACPLKVGKGPRRYQRVKSSDDSRQSPPSCDNDHSTPNSTTSAEGKEYSQFVEERFGRNLDMSLAGNAKLAIRRRIAGALTADVELLEALRITEPTTSIRQVQGLSEYDVYLYPTGMSAIFNTHRTLMTVLGDLKSICFGLIHISVKGKHRNWFVADSLISIRSRFWRNGAPGACSTAMDHRPISMIWSNVAEMAKGFLRSFANFLAILSWRRPILAE